MNKILDCRNGDEFNLQLYTLLIKYMEPSMRLTKIYRPFMGRTVEYFWKVHTSISSCVRFSVFALTIGRLPVMEQSGWSWYSTSGQSAVWLNFGIFDFLFRLLHVNNFSVKAVHTSTSIFTGKLYLTSAKLL